MTIGILGGTFDPPHMGHLGAGKIALDSGLVDKVIYIPCARHAFDKTPQSFSHRLSMCRLLVNGQKNMETSDIENSLENPGRTYDLIVALKKKFSGEEFRLVVGSDIFFEKHRWYKFDLLQKMAPFIYIKRAGEKKIPVKTLPSPARVSSSEIRQMLLNKKHNTSLMPDCVIDYIYKNKLYGTDYG